MTQGQLEQLPAGVVKIFDDLEMQILTDIVRRLKANGFSTATADWQISRLQQLGESEDDIKKWIQEALEATDEEMEKIFSDEVYRQYMGHERAYEAKGLEQIPYQDNIPLQEFVSAIEQQTAGTFQNMTASMGFAIRDPSGKIQYSPLMDFYQTTLDQAVAGIQTGAFSYQVMLERTVNRLTTSGVRWIDYDSGHHNRIDVAARRAVMTGFRQVQGRINEQTAATLGTDTYEVTYHVGARPSHQAWQGKVWTMAQLRSICGLGTVTGLHGANCYHDYNAFIPGVSERVYTDDQLEAMMAKENAPKAYNGRQYTTYEALQQQRAMETAMRKTRQDIRLLEEGGSDEESVILRKAKYQGQLQTYRDFSDKMGLPVQMDRVYQDGLKGSFVPTKKELRSIAKQPKNGKIDVDNKNWSGLNFPQNYRTKRDAIKALSDKYGISFSDSKKYPIDQDILCDAVSWMDAFEKEYPAFVRLNPEKLPHLAVKPPSAMKNAVGYFQYYRSGTPIELALNGKYHTDKAYFEKYEKSCVESKWTVANANTRKTFVHEYGHYVSNSVCAVRGGRWEHDFIQSCVEEYRRKHPDYPGKTYKLLQSECDEVSRYGMTSESECFAECFAEYYGGENPREFARIFGKKLDALLKNTKMSDDGKRVLIPNL